MCYRHEILSSNMASASANWSDIKAQRQHKLQVSAALKRLGPNDPFNIDMTYFNKLSQFPHQHSEPHESGVKGKDARELNGYRQYLGGSHPKDTNLTAESIKFCTQARCTLASVQSGLESLESGYRRHACTAAQYHANHSPAECNLMLKYLDKYSVDGDKIPKTDSTCYEAKNILVKKKDSEGIVREIVKELPCETEFSLETRNYGSSYLTELWTL